MRTYDRDVKDKFAKSGRVKVKKQLAIVLSLVIITLIAVSTFAAIEDYLPSSTHVVAAKKPFYVGVTYCGDSVTEAEQLIDEVKNYTNLFVLQSGPLMWDLNASEQICDYAVKSGLNVIISDDTNSLGPYLNAILSVAQTSWGSHFLGVYFNDEPGGKMLDGSVNFNMNIELNSTEGGISKGEGGVVSFGARLGSGQDVTWMQIMVYPSGEIKVSPIPSYMGISTVGNDSQSTPSNSGEADAPQWEGNSIYYPNGTITYCPPQSNMTFTYQPNGIVVDQNGHMVSNQGNSSQFMPYSQVLDLDPLLNNTDVANVYINNLQSTLSDVGNTTDVNLFTSDYGLYWFDYLGGYNTVFAEQFGAKTDAQALALVRGAADMQDKSWGVMIEPVSQSPLTLQTGDQIYDELRQAYEDGAGYAVVFNYAPNSNSTLGLLQDEQLNALQKFWTDIVQNPKVTNNVKGQDALVLPSGYGGGMRSPTDTIWGIWPADNQSQQVWNAVQASLAKYGSKLDIVYNQPTIGQYQHVYYWNQTI